MSMEKEESMLRGPAHGLEQFKACGRLTNDRPLEQALFVFGASVRVPDDSAADSELYAARGKIHDRRSYGDVEARVAVWRHVTYGATVDPTGFRLEFAHDRHRANLRRASDRRRRMHCGKHVGQ